MSSECRGEPQDDLESRVVVAILLTVAGVLVTGIFAIFLGIGLGEEKWIVPFFVSLPMTLGGALWVAVGVLYTVKRGRADRG